MPDWLVVLIAVVVLGGLLGLGAWWYLSPIDIPGPATPRTERALTAGWLTARMPGEAIEADRAGEFHTDDRPPDTEPWGTCDWGDCEGWAEAWRWGHGHGWLPVCLRHTIEDDNWEPLPDSDDDWADQLHEINQLGKFGDLTRPVAHLTHYEVEALIVQLAVPEWVPDRYRTAA